jgi:hypothetical protein
MTEFKEVGLPLDGLLRRRSPAGMRSSGPVLILQGGIADRVVVYLPVYDVDQVGHAAVVHVPDTLVEPGVDVPVVLQWVEIEVPIAHRNRYVGGHLTFLYKWKEVVQGVPVAADLGSWSKGVEPLLEEGQVAEDQTASELSTGSENSKEMSLAGPPQTFWTMRLVLGRFA